jgi:hypothetical protein
MGTKNPAVLFFREYPCQLQIKLAGDLSPQIRPLFFIYGVSAEINSLSGMTVNLVLVDQWAGQFLNLASQRSWSSLNEFFHFAKKELQTMAAKDLATLAGLEIRDEKQIRWIFDSNRDSIQWRHEFPIVIDDQAQWLVLQADEAVATDSMTSWTQKKWNSLQQLQSELPANIAIQISLKNHGTGSEFRLR